MNLTEQKFWQLINKHLPGDVSRVENSVDDGMPDVNGTYVVDYWAELKVCSNDRKIRNVLKLLRDTQIVWIMRRCKFGAIVFVIVRYETFIVIYNFDNRIFANKLENMEVAYVRLAIVNKTNEFDWSLFRKTILNTIERRIYGICNSRARR